MSFDFRRRGRSLHALSPCSLYDISRKYKENILYDYEHAWDVNNESVIRSCEQKLIKSDKKTLVGYLHQFFRLSQSEEFGSFIIQTKNKYALCVLIHLIHVFCIPGQEEKIKVVQVELNEVLQYCTEEEKFDIFERSISQRLKAKANLIKIDLLTGQIDPQHKFHLKLCYWDIIVWTKNNTEGCKEFLKKNAHFLVSNIEVMATIHPWIFIWHHKRIFISCKILLCFLNWNICKIQTQGILHNRELSAVTYSYTAYQLTNILQKLLSMLTDDNISTIFKDYNNHVMNYGKTPEGLCISETVSNHEFQLKFCNWNRISSKNDNEAYKKFIQLYPEILVSYIEEVVVQQHETKTTISPCKTLLCILNWNVFHQKTSTPEVKKSTRHQYTAYKVSSILQKLLLILSEDEIFKASNDYLEQMYAMNSEITEDDFCTGKIEPYYEFLLKLCYCKKLMNENDDDERCKEFLTRNADLFVSQIEEVVHGNKIITKLASCKVLLHLLNWNICTLKSTLTQSKIQNNAIQEQCSLQSEERNTTKESCTMYKVRCVLQNLLYTLTEDDITEVFNDYMDQMYAIKSEITPDGLCIGEKESHHEFKLKLCYWRTICRKNDYKGYKKFIQLYPVFLVSHIKKRIVFYQGTKTKQFFFKTLLCILNWNICTVKKTPLLDQNAEIQASTSVVIIDDSPPISVVIIDDSPPKYSCTEETIRGILQTLLSSFSEEEIFTAFNNYLDILYTMDSEITEADFCTGKIEPYQEFMMKLCYCKKLCHKKDEETYKNFLTRNAEFLVSKIKEVVDKKNTKTQVISCQVLLCLLKWDICSGKTVYIPPKNILSQMLAQNCQNFMNENAEVFISMKHTKIKRNNIPVLIILCDVLLRIPYNTCHFHDVTGAINKLLRYYATQVGIDERICEWIILFGHRLLKYTKHTQDIHNHTAAEEIHYDFQMLKNFLSDLFTKAMHVGTTFDLLINAFRKETIFYGDYKKEDGIFKYNILNAQDDHINKLWRAKLTCKVKIIQISNNIRKKKKKLHFEIDDNKNCLEFDFAKLSFIDTFKKEVKEDQLKVKTLEDQINAILIIDEMVKKFQLSEMLVLLMMLLIAGTSNGHHKSAKLKKYLTLKYEYDKASLYLLWCSGDIEVHPGPSLNKKTLAHDSTIERRWIQNISPKIINRLPEHDQSKYKPAKKVRNDMENRKHFKSLLKTCQEEQVHVPKMCLDEINAWETKEYKLLHKLFVYRCEIETIIASLKDFLTCGGRTNELTAINTSFDTELQTNDITTILGKDHRPTDKSQLMVYITRHIAGISIKCAHEKDPDAKCDGLWDLPLKNWPKQIILFDPNNRGKYTTPGQKLIPDQELVDILLTLPQVTIPHKYKDIVDAFRTMRKSQKDKSINKQHKAELCSTFKRITSLEKLEYAIKNLWESGVFTEEVHNNLIKWWTTGAEETTDDKHFSQVDINDAGGKERPHIAINISAKSMTLSIEPTSRNSSQVSYNFPFNGELVPLKTMATTVSQTTIHEPSTDSYQKVTSKKYLTDSPKPDACPADIQTNPDKMTVLNLGLPYDLYPIRQKILENDIKNQHRMSSQETALYSTIESHQPISSTNKFRQLNKNIVIAGQPGPILCTPNQSNTNSDDTTSATKDSQSRDYHAQVSPTSDMGSSDLISLVNSDSGNDDQNNISNGSQVILTDSDYSSDSSNNCVSKTNMKKRKLTEEDSNEMKKRKITSLKQDKKPKETNHRHMDNTATFNKNREILPDWLLDIDLDSYDIDDQTFKVDLNALDNEDTELGKFLQDMIDCESEKNVTNEII